MKVRNKDRLFRKLQRLAPEVKKAVEDAGLKGAREMVDNARRLAPVKSGALRDSIVLTGPGQSPPAHSQGGQKGVVPEGAVMVTAGNSRVRYAHVVEFGTSAFVSGGMFEGAQNPGVPPRPYFFPSYRLLRKRIRSRMSRSINQAVKKAIT